MKARASNLEYTKRKDDRQQLQLQIPTPVNTKYDLDCGNSVLENDPVLHNSAM